MMLTKFKSPWNTVVFAAGYIFVCVCLAYPSEHKTRLTTGRLKEIRCSSKDCMIAIQMRNGEEEFFIVYDAPDGIIMKAEKYKGHIVEIESRLNQQRGGLEKVQAIRLKN